jgi:hypothetical protein
MQLASSRDFEVILCGGSVRKVSSDVRLATVVVCWVHVRLMTMGRISISVAGHWCRRAFARECIYYQRVVRCGRGCGQCGISIPQSEYFNRGVAAATVRVTDKSCFEEADKVRFLGGRAE